MNLTEQAAAYAAAAVGRNRPEHVADLILMNLVDWVAVVLGARGEAAGQHVAAVVDAWGMRGDAPLFSGGSSAPVGAALVNGTLAHCLDFDDLHFPSLAHLSAPTWAAVWAFAGRDGCDESHMLDAFSAGFEIGARLGANGVGPAVNDRGWHSTGVHGRISAAVAAGVMLQLDAPRMAHAIAVAATQTSGLTTSFGTMAKPFHAGKAAADGVLAAELAARGFEGATGILDAERSLARALVQDGSVQMRLDGLYDRFEIVANALKPYACCGLTHAAIDCARALAVDVRERGFEAATVQTHPLALKLADERAPRTPLAGKFSTSYCVALGLRGFHASEIDFHASRLRDQTLCDTEARVTVLADTGLEPSAARIEVKLGDGGLVSTEVPVSLGNPDNPMRWPDLEAKFLPLATPQVGDGTQELLATLREFSSTGSARRVLSLL